MQVSTRDAEMTPRWMIVDARTYKGLRLRKAYRIDLIVERAVIVEVKAIDRLHPLIDAQVLMYLKLSGLHTALIINFNVGLLRDGVRRLVL